MDLPTINTPLKPKVREAPKNCLKCSRTLTSEDRKAYFGMDEGFDSDFLQFRNINQAFRVTCLSYCCLSNACEKGNIKIKSRKDGKIFHMFWPGVCVHCGRR